MNKINGISNGTFQYFYNWYHAIIICVVDVKRSAPTACSSAKRQCGGGQPDPQPAGCSHWPSPAPPASPSTPPALPTTPQRYCNWCGRATAGPSPYCARCATAGRECRTCHRPMPDTMMSPKPPTSRWPFTTTGRR